MNTKMTLQEISDVISDVSNSLYNLNKNGLLPTEDYKRLRDQALKLYRDACWTILEMNRVKK